MTELRNNIIFDILDIIIKHGFIYDIGLEHATITYYLEQMDALNYIRIPKPFKRDNKNRIATDGIILQPRGEKFYYE